jgi:hypothetical protein
MKRGVQILLLLLVLMVGGRTQMASDPNEGAKLTSEFDGELYFYRFSWFGVPGRTYFVQHSEDLENWQYVPIVESGAGEVLTWEFSSNSGNFFLRLRYTDTPTSDPAAADFDGDGIANSDEVSNGTDPFDSSSFAATSIEVVEGDAQQGNPGSILAVRLKFGVYGPTPGHFPYRGIPVQLSLVGGGDAAMLAETGDPIADGTVVQSNGDGLVSFALRMPSDVAHSLTVHAAAVAPGVPAPPTANATARTLGPYDPPTGLHLIWRFDGGVTLAWNSNGGSLEDSYTIRRRLSTETAWTDIAQIPATSLAYNDTTIPGSATGEYQVVYSYGTATSAPSNILAVLAYDPAGGSSGNGNGGAGNPVGGPPPAGQDGPQDDPDHDGLTNAQEIEMGTDRNNSDSDFDGVDDDKDGWPLAKFLNTPRLPVPQYAVVELLQDDNAWPVALNNNGDVIYQQMSPANGWETQAYYLAAGQATPIQILNHYPAAPDEEGSPELVGLSDGGKVVGRWTRNIGTTENKNYKTNFYWTPGSTGITYSGDAGRLPQQFQSDSTREIKASNGFFIKGITPGGITYGVAGSAAGRWYDRNRSVTINGFAIEGTVVNLYASQAFDPANTWLRSPRRKPADNGGSVSWTGDGGLINNSGECIFEYFGIYYSGDGPPTGPSPVRGTYFSKDGALGTLVSCGGGVAMNDDLHILASDSILARTRERTAARPSWTSYAAPRISHAKPYGLPTWIDFNNRLEAIGFRTKTEGETTLKDWAVLINDEDYSIRKLIGVDWSIESLVQINENGTILAVARKVDLGTPASTKSIVLLTPIEFTTTDILAGFDYPIDGDPANPLAAGKDEDIPEWWASVGQGPNTGEGLEICGHVNAELASAADAAVLGIHVNPDDTDIIDLTPTQLTGRVTPLTITGKELPFGAISGMVGRVEIGRKNIPNDVVRTLNVMSLVKWELPVRICYVYDSRRDPSPEEEILGGWNHSRVGDQFRIANEIIDRLNRTFAQCGVQFYLAYGSGVIPIDYDDDGDCKLDYWRTNLLADPEMKPFLESGYFSRNMLTVFIVNEFQSYYNFPNPPSETLGFNAIAGNVGDNSTNWVFINSSKFGHYPNPDNIDGYLNTIAHEIGHCLNISTRNYGGPAGSGISDHEHDAGAYPLRYNKTMALMSPTGGDRPEDVWIRNEDWLPANQKAQDIVSHLGL